MKLLLVPDPVRCQRFRVESRTLRWLHVFVFVFVFLLPSGAQNLFPAVQKVVKPSPDPGAPGDAYAPPVSGTAPAGTPVCAEWTRTGGPDETLVMTGAGFSGFGGNDKGKDARFVVFGNSLLRDAKIQRMDSDRVVLTLDKGLPRSMYLIWPKNSKGYGYPVAINKTEGWWVGPDKATRGDTVSVYGRNLSYNNGTTSAYVYLKPAGKAGQWVSPVRVNPYKVDFLVPAGLSNGQYEVWVHNGHGGVYGWSGPLQLGIDNGFQWTSTVFNVKTYGAKGNGVNDDTAPILAALADAHRLAGSTVFFPAGVYLISNTLTLDDHTRWLGEGKTKTVLKCAAAFSTAARSVVMGSPVRAEIRDMGFDRHAMGATHNIDKAFYLRQGSHVRLVNVGLHFPGLDVWDFHAGRYYEVKNCSVVGHTGFLGDCSQLFIDRCSFGMTNDSEMMLHSWGGAGVSLTNSTCSDFNNSDPNNGAGWGKGRFFVANGFWGSNRFTYLGNNTTSNLTVRLTGPDLNSGEQFLWEGSSTFWSGAVTSSTATATTLNGLKGLSTDVCYAVVVKGKGFGQLRRISSYASGTITLAEPWNLIPDKTSIVSVGAYTDKVVIYKNYLDGKPYAATHKDHIASAGIEPFGGVFNMVADSNTLNELRTGIANWAINSALSPGNVDPGYFNLFANNRFVNCRWAISNMPAAATSNNGTALFGTIYRRNTIKNTVVSGIFNMPFAVAQPVLSTMVYEHNSLTDVPAGFESGTQGVDNQVLYNNSFNRGAATTQNGAVQVTPNAVLRQNVYQGFTAVYKNALPGIIEAPYHVIELAGDTSGPPVDSSLSLWNSGSSALNWTATSSAAWLTVSVAAGTIQNEGSSGLIRFRAQPKGLAAGTHTGTIKVTASGQVRSYSVVFKVRALATCSGAGGMTWKYWANMATTKTIADIPVSSTPTGTQFLTSFAAPVNKAENFGAQIKGYLCPPLTGNYVFSLASDDQSELWLSTGSTESGKQKIAFVSGYTPIGDYGKYASQLSKPVYLQAGQRYYIEALHREGVRTDHLSVGWLWPDGTLQRPIAGAHMIPFEAGATAAAVVKADPVAQQNAPAASLKIYPNPAQYRLTVVYSVPENSRVTLQLYTMQGVLLQHVFSGSAEAGKTYTYELSTDRYESGSYICRLVWGDKMVEQQWILTR